MSVAFAGALFVWVRYLRANKANVTRVHHMMTVLLSVKMIDVLFECAMYSYIAQTGHNSAWNACVGGSQAHSDARVPSKFVSPVSPPLPPTSPLRALQDVLHLFVFQRIFDGRHHALDWHGVGRPEALPL